MDHFAFRYLIDKNADGIEGLLLYGKSPDHATPQKIINDFIGKDVLRLAGNAMGTHLFLPLSESKYWQVIAGWEEVWLSDEKGHAVLDLLMIGHVHKFFYGATQQNELLQCICGWEGKRMETIISMINTMKNLAGWWGMRCKCPFCDKEIKGLTFGRS